MPEERKMEELLTVLLMNLHQLSKGLCALAATLHHQGLINKSEFYRIYEYLYDHIPSDARGVYWYEIGLKGPRRDYLEGQIKELKGGNNGRN